MKARQKGLGLRAWNLNPLWLHIYLNKPSVSQAEEANQIKQDI